MASARTLGLARPETVLPVMGGAGDNAQTTTKVLEFFREQKGMDLTALPDGSARGGVIVQGLEIVDGVLQRAFQSQPTAAVGSPNELIAVFPHHTTAGVEKWIFCKRGGIVEIHTDAWKSSASVVTATGPGLSFDFVTARPSFVSWGDRVLICNGTNGLIDVNVGAGTYAIVAGAPTGRHISIITNRVVITAITGQPYRVQWSVKNNYLDWTGFGSGFEDLRDVVFGSTLQLGPAVSYDETFAFLFADRAILAMVPTDYFDAPFRFTTMEGFEGTRTPYSIARCPDGLLYVGLTNAWIIGRGGKKAIGTPVKSILKHATVSSIGVTGAYDRRRNAYVIASSQGENVGGEHTYHCYLGENFQWTRQQMGGSNLTQNIFEYPDVVAATTGVISRTQYSSIGFISGIDQFAYLKREYEQMWEGSISQSALPITFTTQQIIVGDPARTFTITEMQLIVSVLDATTIFTWQPSLIASDGTKTTLPHIVTTGEHKTAFVESLSNDSSLPIRWLYIPIAMRQTITSGTVMIENVIANLNDGLPFRIYGLRIFVTEGPKVYE